MVFHLQEFVPEYRYIISCALSLKKWKHLIESISFSPQAIEPWLAIALKNRTIFLPFFPRDSFVTFLGRLLLIVLSYWHCPIFWRNYRQRYPIISKAKTFFFLITFFSLGHRCIHQIVGEIRINRDYPSFVFKEVLNVNQPRLRCRGNHSCPQRCKPTKKKRDY